MLTIPEMVETLMNHGSMTIFSEDCESSKRLDKNLRRELGAATIYYCSGRRKS